MARHDEARAVAVREVGVRLAAAGIPSPEVDARWLVDHVVEVAGDPVGCGAALLDGLVARRLRREPLQQVLGRAWFRRLELRCAPGVFVPRPETEIVAGLAIAAARAAHATAASSAEEDGPGSSAEEDGPVSSAEEDRPASSAEEDRPASSAEEDRPASSAEEDGPASSAEDGAGRRVRVAEPCTGTGAIALSIGVEVPDVELFAADIDPAAVELATTNLARVHAGVAGAPMARGSSVTVVASELLEGVDPSWRGHLDVLVANPPYLPAADRATWQPEVADHDPDRALIGGPDGHEVVDALLELAATWLTPGGTVVLEIDERRGTDATTAAHAAGLTEIRIERDLTGADRAIVARRPATDTAPVPHLGG